MLNLENLHSLTVVEIFP